LGKETRSASARRRRRASAQGRFAIRFSFHPDRAHHAQQTAADLPAGHVLRQALLEQPLVAAGEDVLLLGPFDRAHEMLGQHPLQQPVAGLAGTVPVDDLVGQVQRVAHAGVAPELVLPREPMGVPIKATYPQAITGPIPGMVSSSA